MAQFRLEPSRCQLLLRILHILIEERIERERERRLTYQLCGAKLHNFCTFMEGYPQQCLALQHKTNQRLNSIPNFWKSISQSIKCVPKIELKFCSFILFLLPVLKHPELQMFFNFPQLNQQHPNSTSNQRTNVSSEKNTHQA